MSEAGKYDGERCEGCVHARPQNDHYVTCLVDPKTPGLVRWNFYCVGFEPSLQCRQVRALERIADSLDEFGGCLRSDGRGGCTFDVTVQP